MTEPITANPATEPAYPTEAWAPVSRPDPRWSLAFVGVLGYLAVEYMRLPLAYEFLRPYHLGKVVIIVAALGWLLAPRTRIADRSIIRRIDIAMLVLLAGGFFSTVFARQLDLALEGYVDLLKWGIIYLVLSRTVNSSWRMKIVIFIILLLNVKLARGGIRYFYGTMATYGEEVAVRHGAKGGSVGFFSNSADLGVAMCVVWPIAFMLLFAKLKGKWRILLAASSLVFIFTILICGSRGAVVGAACTVMAGLLMSRKRIAALVMALLMIPGIIYVIPDASKVRFKSAWELEGDMTAQSRLVFWRAGLMMFRDHPVFGVGIKNFATTRLLEYAQVGGPEHAYVPHSIYIEALSEHGAVGFISFMVLLWNFFRLNSRSRQVLLSLGDEKRRGYEYGLTVGLDLAMIGYLSSGAFVAVFQYPHLWILLGLSVGLYTACCRMQQAAAAPVAQPAESVGKLRMVTT